MSVVREIILCAACKGVGWEELNEVTDYHKRDYRYWWVECRRCEGSGRIIKTTTTKVEVTPHPGKTPKPE